MQQTTLKVSHASISNTNDVIGDNLNLTPSRFLAEQGGTGLTPGLLTRYGANSDQNPFEQSFTQLQ